MNVGLSYRIIRWPFVIVIGFIILCELCMYIFVRSFVVAYEYSRRGLKGLRDQILQAKTFDEWKTSATEMDRLQKKDVWRTSNDEIPPLYDVPLITNLYDQLRRYSNDLPEDPKDRYNKLSKLAVTLEVACKNNLGGIENEHLYSRTYLGTKKLIEDYLHEVQHSLNVMFDSDFPVREKRKLFKRLCKEYGKTALCLSGGATFGFYHLGVIKTLIEQDCQPKIVAGTSAGALIAALVCVRTDSELAEILHPSLHSHLKSSDDTLFDTVFRFLKLGVLYDVKQWTEKIRWITNGDTTFLEAYNRTGKILNISAVPTERHSPPKLLNYLNAPNVVIWSAVIASAAVPGLIEAPELWYKDENGIQPWHSIGKKWRDGSLKTDIPISTLSAQFNVKYTIVSQVNPHVVPFFFNKRGSSGSPSLHRAGQGWRGGFVLSSLEHFLKLDLTKWLRLMRDLDLLPAVLGQDWSYVFLQKFEGNVTILPRVIVRDYFRLITDPDEKELDRYITGGQRATWPKISMILNRMKIEQFVFECKAKLAPPRRDSL